MKKQVLIVSKVDGIQKGIKPSNYNIVGDNKSAITSNFIELGLIDNFDDKMKEKIIELAVDLLCYN
jgi:hypothetical protein